MERIDANHRADKMNPARFPLGASISLDDLIRDPYPIYARLQAEEPVSWMEALNMWYVTRYEDVHAILMDDRAFTTAWRNSLIFDTFGPQMLTSEAAEHVRYRRPIQPRFSAAYIRNNLEETVRECAAILIRDIKPRCRADLRGAFAARLPVQAMLKVFGLPLEAEARMRGWYDSFERALSNYAGSEQVRAEARKCVAECHAYLDEFIRRSVASGEDASLLAKFVHAEHHERLTDEEIRRNMLIIMFGGISTVEALILNCLWALFAHPAQLKRVLAEPPLLNRVIEETLRWLSPVQSATRHVTQDTVYKGVQFRQGEIVNCMLGAANRDPTQFRLPELFDIDRPNQQRHVAFATGVHSCLGFQLAKAEARIGLQLLLQELQDLRLVSAEQSAPRGNEFRQPRAMPVEWT